MKIYLGDSVYVDMEAGMLKPLLCQIHNKTNLTDEQIARETAETIRMLRFPNLEAIILSAIKKAKR